MKSGIYRIYSIKTEQSYYGSTRNFRCRFNEHKSLLKRKKHGNKKLQKIYDLYGIENLKFEILCSCAKEEFEEVEKKYIDEDKNKLNIWLYPFSPKNSETIEILKKRNHIFKGKKRPELSHPHTEETKKLLSDKAKQHIKNYGSWNLGKVTPDEVRQKIREGVRRYAQKNGGVRTGAKLSEETKLKISQSLKDRYLSLTKAQNPSK